MSLASPFVLPLFVSCLFVLAASARSDSPTIQTSLSPGQEEDNRDEELYMSGEATSSICDLDCCNEQGCGDEIQQTGAESRWTCDKIAGGACYSSWNSPYLGEYFPDEVSEDRATSIEDYNRLVKKRVARRSSWAHQPPLPVKPTEEALPYYRYGSPLVVEGGSYLKTPVDPLGSGYCTDSVPVLYLVERQSHCQYRINKETCPGLALPKVDPSVLDGSTESLILIPSRTVLYQKGEVVEEDLVSGAWDEERGICRGGLVSTRLKFTWNGTLLTRLRLDYTLSDLPAALVYVKQSVSVVFRPVPRRPIYTNRTTNYRLGDTLLVLDSSSSGCKKEEEDESTGEEERMVVNCSRPLRLWTDGGDCGESWAAMNVGLDVSYSCLIKPPEDMDCAAISEYIEEIQTRTFENDGVMVDKNSYDNLIPILRMDNSSSVMNDTLEICLLPLSLIIRVLYTHSSTDEDKYSITGFSYMFEKSPVNIETLEEDGKLVLKSYVLYTEALPRNTLSRFWLWWSNRAGSSYSWHGLLLYSHPDSATLILCILAVLLLALLRPFY